MYIVTNTIQTEANYSEKIIQQFTSRHTKENMKDVDGFIDFQLMYRDLPEDSTVVELVVMSRWETKEYQKNWVKSQSFKNMHQKESVKATKPAEQSRKRLGFISSKISEYTAVN